MCKTYNVLIKLYSKFQLANALVIMNNEQLCLINLMHLYELLLKKILLKSAKIWSVFCGLTDFVLRA